MIIPAGNKPYPGGVWQVHFISPFGYSTFTTGEKGGGSIHVRKLRELGLKAWYTPYQPGGAGLVSRAGARGS